MTRWYQALVLLASGTLLVAGCGDDDSTKPAERAGTITAQAEHITDRQGDALLIAVYDSSVDWVPGTDNDLIISSTLQTISSDDYSLTHVMQEMNESGEETGTVKTFDPAIYSVLFYAAAAGSPPDHFAEIRVHVNGDIVSAAPAWGTWSSAGAGR